MGDAENVGLDVFVGDERDEALEGLRVGGEAAGQPVPVQVLGESVLREDLEEHTPLNSVGVCRHVLDELEGLPVILGRCIAFCSRESGRQ